MGLFRRFVVDEGKPALTGMPIDAIVCPSCPGWGTGLCRVTSPGPAGHPSSAGTQGVPGIETQRVPRPRERVTRRRLRCPRRSVPCGIVSFAQRLIGHGKVASIHGEMTFYCGEGAETNHGGSGYRIAEGGDAG
jgi:hypothetical protein